MAPCSDDFGSRGSCTEPIQGQDLLLKLRSSGSVSRQERWSSDSTRAHSKPGRLQLQQISKQFSQELEPFGEDMRADISWTTTYSGFRVDGTATRSMSVGSGGPGVRNHLLGALVPFIKTLPRHSMYARYAYIGVVLGVNVGIYGIHGVFGLPMIWLPRALFDEVKANAAARSGGLAWKVCLVSFWRHLPVPETIPGFLRIMLIPECGKFQRCCV